MVGTSVLNRILKFPLIYADLGFALLGSPKKLKKYSLIRFPSHGGFSIGFLKIPIDNMPIIHRDLPKWPRRSLGWTSVGKPWASSYGGSLRIGSGRVEPFMYRAGFIKTLNILADWSSTARKTIGKWWFNGMLMGFNWDLMGFTLQ